MVDVAPGACGSIQVGISGASSSAIRSCSALSTPLGGPALKTGSATSSGSSVDEGIGSGVICSASEAISESQSGINSALPTGAGAGSSASRDSSGFSGAISWTQPGISAGASSPVSSLVSPVPIDSSSASEKEIGASSTSPLDGTHPASSIHSGISSSGPVWRASVDTAGGVLKGVVP